MLSGSFVALQALVVSLLVSLGTAGIAAAQDYRIQPGDSLEVSVLEDPGLNRQVLVRPDGKISMPLAGTIEAAGRTPEAVQAAIRRALARDFVEPPTVTVSLLRIAEAAPPEAASAAAIYVIGAVNNPGRFDVAAPIDILQALALSGGLGAFAATDRIQVRRRSDGAETVLTYDYDLVEDGVVPSQPIELQDRDVIVVPERGLFD